MTPLLAATANRIEPIGLRADGTPIWLHVGADGWNNFAEPDGGEEDAEGGEEDADGGEEDAEVEVEVEEYTPPTEEQWRKSQEAIKRNNGENKRLRLLRKAASAKGIDLSTDDGVQALQDLLAGGGTNAGGKGTSDRGAAERAAERAAAKADAKYIPVLTDLALKAALVDAGFSGRNPERVMKLVDMDEIDVVDGKVTGISEQIDGIKEDFPEWFRPGNTGGKPAGSRRGASDVDGGERRTKPAGKTQTWADRLDKQMTGG